MMARIPPAMPETVSFLRLLLLEDDELLRDRVLVPQMRKFGFEVTAIGRAADLDRCLEEQRPDIVLLDIGLPDGDGYALARRLRATHEGVGIVMLTGRTGSDDQVRGLSEGADAYLPKPVDIDVLVATLHSLARRLRVPQPPSSKGIWRLDAEGWCLVSPAGDLVALTKTERQLLEVLIEKPNQVVSRDDLIAGLTHDVHDFDTHRLDSLIHRLRRKVLRVLGVPLPLNVVRSEGYVLVVVP